jgi:hypothetical protein
VEALVSLTMSLVVTLASAAEMRKAGAIHPYGRWATAFEVVAVFACILLYIWRWQAPHPLLWIPLLAFVILSQVLHHDSPRAMGLTLAQLRSAAQLILPIAAAIYVPVLVFALITHRLVLAWPGETALDRFAGYAIWCCFQQYLVQCYFHRRLMSLIRTPHVSSVVVACMFAAAHIPNAVLIVATLIGGFILAEVYKRHQNIWPLALAQALGGSLIAALVPASIIHNMRVGPGYYTFRPR